MLDQEPFVHFDIIQYAAKSVRRALSDVLSSHQLCLGTSLNSVLCHGRSAHTYDYLPLISCLRVDCMSQGDYEHGLDHLEEMVNFVLNDLNIVSKATVNN